MSLSPSYSQSTPTATFTTSGKVKQTVYNVKDYNAIGDGSTDDHTAFNNAIIACNAAGGGIVYASKATYNFTSPVTMLSNVTLMGDGLGSTFMISAMTASNRRGIVNINNQNNVIIKGITFNSSVGCTGITSYGHNGLLISECGFTGTTNTSSSGIIGITGETAFGSTIGAFNTQIEKCKFYDITILNARTINIHPANGNYTEDIRIVNNYFNNVGGPAVSLDCADICRKILVQGNTAINLRQGNVTGDITSASLVFGGIATSNTVSYLTITNNFFYNTNTATGSGFLAGIYSCRNVVISNNVAIGAYNPDSGSVIQGPFVSVGRVSTPCVGVVISNNYIQGFNYCWDPDSMEDVEVFGNVAYRCGGDFYIGYNYQQYVRVHHNTFHNSTSYSFLNGTGIGNTQGSGHNEYSDNTIIDDRSIPAPTILAATLQTAAGTLTIGTPYYYVVTALDAVGETLKSSEVTATPTSGHQTITVTWQPVTGAQGYNVYRSTTSGTYTTPALIGTTFFAYGAGGGTASLADTGLTATTGSPPGSATVAPTKMIYGIEFKGGGDCSDTTMKNNRYYMPYGTFTNAIKLQNGTEIVSRVFQGNEFHDSSGVIIYDSIFTSYIAKTGTYTATALDSFIDCTSGTFTVTLPTAVNIAGREYIIKNSGSGVITVATTSAQTIDGGSTAVLKVQYVSVTVKSDGANWKVI